MTPDELAAIKARAEAATEGPWEWGEPSDENWPSMDQNLWTAAETNGDREGVVTSWGYDADGINASDADRAFIAHARQDIPNLLTEVERLLAVIDRVREVHAEGEFGCPYPSHGCNEFYYRGNYCADSGTSCEACGEAYPCPTIAILDAVTPERTGQEREAAVERVADLLAEHVLGETWGDDGITFVGCDCGEWFGRALDDAHEAGRMHIARAAVAAYEGRA